MTLHRNLGSSNAETVTRPVDYRLNIARQLTYMKAPISVATLTR